MADTPAGQGLAYGGGQFAFRDTAVVVVRSNFKALEDGDEAFHVVGVGMAGHGRFETRRPGVGQVGPDHGPAHIIRAGQASAIHQDPPAAGQLEHHGLPLAHIEHGQADAIPAVGQGPAQPRTDEQGQTGQHGGQGALAAGHDEGQAGQKAEAAEHLRPGRAQDRKGKKQSPGVQKSQNAHKPFAEPGRPEQQRGTDSGHERERQEHLADQRHRRDHEAEQRQPGNVDPGIEVPFAEKSHDDRQHGSLGAKTRPQDAEDGKDGQP